MGPGMRGAEVNGVAPPRQSASITGASGWAYASCCSVRRRCDGRLSSILKITGPGLVFVLCLLPNTIRNRSASMSLVVVYVCLLFLSGRLPGYRTSSAPSHPGSAPRPPPGPSLDSAPTTATYQPLASYIVRPQTRRPPTDPTLCDPHSSTSSDPEHPSVDEEVTPAQV